MYIRALLECTSGTLSCHEQVLLSIERLLKELRFYCGAFDCLIFELIPILVSRSP